jgi:hypothetical protein
MDKFRQDGGMRIYPLGILLLFTFALGGCSRYGEGDRVFVDLTAGGVEQSAYLAGTVRDEDDGKVVVQIDSLHCEPGCEALPHLDSAVLRPGRLASFALESVQPWEFGKANYDERLAAYRKLVAQREQRGVLYRVSPQLLATMRPMMEQAGFRQVLAVIALAELEQQHFTDPGGEKLLREVIEAMPRFIVALKQRLKAEQRYQTVRRLRSEVELATLRGEPDRLYLRALFHELEALQRLLLDYLLPPVGADEEAMALHFRYVEPALVAEASRALADFYSDECQYLPAGQGCAQYRASFQRRAMHRLVSRLQENLAMRVAAKQPLNEQQQVGESLSLFRFILNLRGTFPGEELLSREEVERLVRQNAR